MFDALTLKRIDMFWENLWVIAHLAVAAACIILANRNARPPLAAAAPSLVCDELPAVTVQPRHRTSRHTRRQRR